MQDHQHRSKDHDCGHGKQTDHPGSHQICDWLDPSTPSPQQVLRQLVYRRIMNETSALLEETQKALDELIAIENAGCEMEDGEAKAKYFYEKVTRCGGTPCTGY